MTIDDAIALAARPLQLELDHGKLEASFSGTNNVVWTENIEDAREVRGGAVSTQERAWR